MAADSHPPEQGVPILVHMAARWADLDKRLDARDQLVDERFNRFDEKLDQAHVASSREHHEVRKDLAVLTGAVTKLTEARERRAAVTGALAGAGNQFLTKGAALLALVASASALLH